MSGRAGGELTLRKSRLAALLIWLAPLAAQADPTLLPNGAFTWYAEAPWFGGLSAAEVSPDGAKITVISDRGRLLQAKLTRTDGQITNATITASRQLAGADGKKLRGRYTDAEGLAIANTGAAFISFENRHGVARLDLATGETVPLPAHPDFAGLQPNAGLEALAVGPDGTLYTLPERSGSGNTPFPLYAYANGTWRIAARLPRRGPFLPVGADIDAAGLLYLLERTVTPLGFRNRIRRFDLTAPNLGEVTLMTSLPGLYDNLEALSLWRDKTGTTHLTLISDDNFYPIQRTQIVEFILTE